ncbi:MAG: GNAT family N-acetyltransferase [Clostridia bacterium]|nr:GNAT family N-acetyltransferase [Clostridia bacterium]
MIIRDAVIEDIEELAGIYNWAVANTTASFDINVQSLESRRQWFNGYGGKYPLLVAETDGKIIGYTSLSKFREKEGFFRTVELSVYIHPDYHGRGAGKALMKEVIERARSLEHHVIMACITAGNDISVGMHERLGFEFCGRIRHAGYKFEQWQDLLLYQLIL